LTSVQKYFKPLIFESKILFKIQKKKEFMLHPNWFSAHFVTRPIFVSPSAPTSGFHRLPPSASIGTAVLCAADCHPPPRVKSQTEASSCRLHFPH
jgi:hypothetical protein